MRRPRPHHWKTHLVENFGQIQDKHDRFLVQRSCSPVEPLHLQQRLSRCALCSSVSHVRHIPFHTMPPLPPLHLWRPQPLPPSDHCGQQSNGPLARDIFRYQENRVVQACCGHFPQCSTLSKKMTSSSLVPFERFKKDSWVETITACSCRSLKSSWCLLQTFLPQLVASLPLHSTTSHSFTACLPPFASRNCIANALPVLASSPRISSRAWHLLLVSLSPATHTSNQWVCLRSMLLLLRWLKSSFPIVEGLPHLIDLHPSFSVFYPCMPLLHPAVEPRFS